MNSSPAKYRVMSQNRKPFLIIVSAPSGSGKTTIVQRLLQEDKDIERSVSFTTREPRVGEKDKVDYIFVSKDEFEKKKEQGEFLEFEENFGNYYGTSALQIKEALKEEKDIILSIDVRGARQVRQKVPGCVSVFIMPPDIDELTTRLRNRNTDGEEQLSLRLQESGREMKAAVEFDHTIINETLEEAVKELKRIIEEERRKKKT